MRAYNNKKISREHILFLKKHKKLSFTKWHYISEKQKIPKHINIFISNGELFFDNWYTFDYIKSLKKILKGKGFYSISREIKDFERRYNIKIENLGLTRDDFSANLKNLEKIYKKLNEYKNHN